MAELEDTEIVEITELSEAELSLLRGQEALDVLLGRAALALALVCLAWIAIAIIRIY